MKEKIDIHKLNIDIIDDVNFGTTVIEFQEYLREHGWTMSEWSSQKLYEYLNASEEEQGRIRQRCAYVNEQKCLQYPWTPQEYKYDSWADPQ